MKPDYQLTVKDGIIYIFDDAVRTFLCETKGSVWLYPVAAVDGADLPDNEVLEAMLDPHYVYPSDLSGHVSLEGFECEEVLEGDTEAESSIFEDALEYCAANPSYVQELAYSVTEY